jgi:hypothetical protein
MGDRIMGDCFELADVFPVIEEVIGDLCRRDGQATHQAIANELMKHKHGALLVEAGLTRRPDRTSKWIASNMAQWFSKKYTDGELGSFEARFMRRKINRAWAYLPQ